MKALIAIFMRKKNFKNILRQRVSVEDISCLLLRIFKDKHSKIFNFLTLTSGYIMAMSCAVKILLTSSVQNFTTIIVEHFVCSVNCFLSSWHTASIKN